MQVFRRADAVVVCRGLDEAEDGLSAAERALVDEAGSERRRAELRGGRAAAREAFSALHPHRPPPQVLTHPDGRPLLVPQDGRFVSLAHDDGYVAAAASTSPVGLDVLGLHRAAQAARVVEARIASGRATGLPRGAYPWPEAALLWTAWEALGKRTGRGVLSEAMLLRLMPEAGPEGLVARTANASVFWWEAEGLLLCLAASTRLFGEGPVRHAAPP